MPGHSYQPRKERETINPARKQTLSIVISHREPGRGSSEVIAKAAINLLDFSMQGKRRAGSRNWVTFEDLRWSGPTAPRGQASKRILLGTATMAGKEWTPALRRCSKIPTLPVQPHERKRGD